VSLLEQIGLRSGKEDSEIAKLEQQINSLKEKKEALQRSIGIEIHNLNTSIANTYMSIGSQAYDMYLADGVDLSLLTEKFEAITELKRKITAKEQQSKEIGQRHDEEIGLLENLIQNIPAESAVSAESTLPTAGSTVPVGGALSCPKCNKPITPDDAFCMKCGQKLK